MPSTFLLAALLGLLAGSEGSIGVMHRITPQKTGMQRAVPLAAKSKMCVASARGGLRLRGGEGGAEDISGGDGGVMKELLVEGVGEEFPRANDDVSVHYVGTLQTDGTEFDSSRARNAPFTFKLGQGKVIKGWDIGVATMKRGEKSRFTISSDYAYGPTGSGDKIPGNSTLIFEVELLRWNEKEVTLDGGVYLKPGDKKGTGWRHPDKNDEVYVSYVGRVEDAEFARSEGFELIKLGDKSSPLPSGVERAICKEMKKGSSAIITCHPEYAFGKEGLPGKVPPDATVHYEVELKDWNAVYDVCRDGGIIVKCLGQLDTYGPLCDDASQIKLTIEGKLLPGGEVFMPVADKQLTVGDGALPEGLERGLEKIKKGQHATICLEARYAYGEAGSTDPEVPPNSTVLFDVKVSDVVPTYQLQLSDKLAAAEKRKDQGNALFKDGNTERAVTKYDKAFKLIQYEQGEGDEADRVKDIKSVIHVNKAACYDKEGRTEDVVNECNKALDLRGSNVKALFRRGRAYIGQGKLEDAKKDMDQLLNLEPGNKAATNQLNIIKDKQRVQDNKDKAVYSKMFAKPAKKDDKKEEEEEKKEEVQEKKVEKEDDDVVELGDDTRVR